MLSFLISLTHAEWDLGPCRATKWNTSYWTQVGLQGQVRKWRESGTIQISASCQGLHSEAWDPLWRDLVTSCELSINQSAIYVCTSEWSTAPSNGCCNSVPKWRSGGGHLHAATRQLPSEMKGASRFVQSSPDPCIYVQGDDSGTNPEFEKVGARVAEWCKFKN